MFQNVARAPRREPLRELPALLLAVSLPCTVLSLLSYFEPQVANVAAAVQDQWEGMIPIRPPDLPAPAPSVAPRRGGGGGHPSRVIPTPISAPAPVVADAPIAAVPAPEGGTNEGGSGPGDGPPGDPQGTGTGDLGGGGGGVRAVHWSEIQVRTRVLPEIPAAMQQLGIAEANCVVRLQVDPSGTPESVTLKACPAYLQAAARDAAMQWRFYPLIEDGQAMTAAFDLRMVFRQN